MCVYACEINHVLYLLDLVVEFERTAYSVNESSGIVTLRVVTSNSSAVPTVLNIQTRDGSANGKNFDLHCLVTLNPFVLCL